MSTNQITTQENSKKCSKKKIISKYISVLSLILLIISMLCISANAIVMQDVTSTESIYPSLLMDIETANNDESRIEISGAGEESLYQTIEILTQAGSVYYYDLYEESPDNPEEYLKHLSEYSTSNAEITRLSRLEYLNINLWEWSQRYNDTIIWQLWDSTSSIDDIYASYYIEIPYFNNSAIMGTRPLSIEVNKTIYGNLDSQEGAYYSYDLDLPNINDIINEAMRVIESDSQGNITFQYNSDELMNHNYVTNVYAEDGSIISVDFKQALSTILVRFEYYINGETQSIAILNYNDPVSNIELSVDRSIDFTDLVLENEFERSADITVIRKEKDVRLLSWLGNAIKGIMNVELFPNFSLGALLSVIIMIPIILWILKLVAGG